MCGFMIQHLFGFAFLRPYFSFSFHAHWNSLRLAVEGRLDSVPLGAVSAFWLTVSLELVSSGAFFIGVGCLFNKMDTVIRRTWMDFPPGGWLFAWIHGFLPFMIPPGMGCWIGPDLE